MLHLLELTCHPWFVLLLGSHHVFIKKKKYIYTYFDTPNKYSNRSFRFNISNSFCERKYVHKNAFLLK